LTDRWLGIQTCSPADARYLVPTTYGDPVPYEPVDYVLLKQFMAPVVTTTDDVVVEIGCGMGRTLCLFARRPVRKCIGFDIAPTLVEIARENVRRLRGRRTEVEVLVADAVDADYDGGTLYWMFNPFGEQTMRRVVDRLEASWRRNPRRLRMVYVNPLHDGLLQASGWLRRTGEVASPYFQTYPASYWESIDPKP